MVKPYISELQLFSKERVSHSKDFAYLLEDIEQVKKRKDEKTISLNEKARLQEKEQEKARQDARKKERAARPHSTAGIFELDLEMAEGNKPLQAFNPAKTKEDVAEVAKATPRMILSLKRTVISKPTPQSIRTWTKLSRLRATTRRC
jgi:hypothetical protein